MFVVHVCLEHLTLPHTQQETPETVFWERLSYVMHCWVGETMSGGKSLTAGQFLTKWRVFKPSLRGILQGILVRKQTHLWLEPVLWIFKEMTSIWHAYSWGIQTEQPHFTCTLNACLHKPMQGCGDPPWRQRPNQVTGLGEQENNNFTVKKIIYMSSERCSNTSSAPFVNAGESTDKHYNEHLWMTLVVVVAVKSIIQYCIYKKNSVASHSQPANKKFIRHVYCSVYQQKQRLFKHAQKVYCRGRNILFCSVHMHAYLHVCVCVFFSFFQKTHQIIQI